MLETSATWKALAATGESRMLTKAIINGVEYTDITAPIIDNALMQDSLSIGNCVAASCTFVLRTTDTIARSAEVRILMQLTDGNTSSEWVTRGIYYIARRSRDPVTGLLTLECYDSMLRANVTYPAFAPLTDENGTYITDENGTELEVSTAFPRPMKEVVEECAFFLGVDIDSRTTIKSGTGYTVPASMGNHNPSIREVLQGIAAVHGGNWIITAQNKLRLVTLADMPTDSTTGLNSIRGVVGKLALREPETITGVKVTLSDGTETIYGAKGGIVMRVQTECANNANMTALANTIVGYTYAPCTLSSAVYDPAIELGDPIKSKDDVYSYLYSERATFGIAFRGDISAPNTGELSDEYPYIGTTQEALKALQQRMNAGEVQAQSLDLSLDQQGIFDRLTADGVAIGLRLESHIQELGADVVKQLYIDGTYVDRGVIQDKSRMNYWILDDSEESGEFVTRKGQIGGFTIADGELSYADEDGNSANISTSGAAFVSYGKTATQYEGLYGVSLDGEKLEFTANNENVASLETQYYAGDTTNPQFYGLWVNVGGTAYLSATNEDGDMMLNIAQNCDALGNLRVYNDFTVFGTKSRVAETADYSRRRLYCYETTSPYFGDIGDGVIDEDGTAYIWLDDVFAETINANQYQVFLQAYGAGECYVSERTPSHFVVKGAAGMRFGWEVKAKQADYDQMRMENDDEFTPTSAVDYGADAAEFIMTLSAERVI